MASTINPNPRAEPPSPSHPHKHPTVFDSRFPQHDRRPVCPGSQLSTWDWVHLPWCWGREDEQVYVFGVQAHGHPVASQGVLVLFLFGWALTFLLPLQSIHEKSWRNSTSLNYLLLKDAQWELLLIHPRDTLCGWTSQQRPPQAASLSFHMDRHSQQGQITSPEKLPRCGRDLCQLCQHGSVKEKKGQDLAGLNSSVPTLWLCIPANWSPAPSPRNSAKAAAGRKSQHGNISSSLKMPAAEHHPGFWHASPGHALAPGGSVCHPKPGS